MLVVTAEEMREMDRLTIQKYGVSSLVLMERAGEGMVDAILGTGIKDEVRGLYAEAITFMNASGVPIVAVDIPSGLHTDKGTPLGVSIQAEMTVSLGYPKLGEVIYPGLSYVGDLVVAE